MTDTKKRTPQPRRTEAQMTELLRNRFTKPGNGGAGEYAFMAQVRNGAGFSATRTLDAVTMSLWPSRGLELHGFEIKCARSDWLKELRDPKKADDMCRYLDRFTVVVSDEDFVKPEELPDTWGLIAVRNDKLVDLVPAPKLPGSDRTRPVNRDFLVCMLRSAGAVPKVDPQWQRDIREQESKRIAASWEQRVAQLEATLTETRQVIQDFERAAGVSIRGASWSGGGDPKTVGAALKAVLVGEQRATQAQQQMVRAHEQLLNAAKNLEPFLPEPVSHPTERLDP